MSTTSNTSLRSTVKEGGVLELSLIKEELPALKENEILVRVEAAALNPSDLATMLATADGSSFKAQPARDGLPVSQGTIPQRSRGLKMVTSRCDQPLPIGNEGAGTVVQAGSSAAAQMLLGSVVGVSVNVLTEYKVMPVEKCNMIFPEGTTPAQAASWFVNPATVMGFVETMRAEGHKAMVHTAAASALGQMLVKLCIKDNIPLVCIVRKKEQEDILKDLGAKYIVNSTSANFDEELFEAVKATGATIGFDAIGGGDMACKILQAMERALTEGQTTSVYGSMTHKQVYIYGGLSFAPIAAPPMPTCGFAWGIGGWLLHQFMAKKPELMPTIFARAASEISTTFATNFDREISLEGALDPKNIAFYSQQSTGTKTFVNPSKQSSYRLVYHNMKHETTGKRCGGRAEPIRLFMEDVGVPMEVVDTNRAEFVAFGGQGVFSSNYAPPVLQKVNEKKEVTYQISQLAAIMEFLAEDLNVHFPATQESRAYARQINLDLGDMLVAGRAPFHAKENLAGYATQKDDPVVIKAIADFQAEGGKLGKWLGHFESFLTAAERRGTGGTPFFASKDQPSYVDFVSYQVFFGVQGSFPGCLEKYPKIQALMKAIESRPNIAEFLKSDRRWVLAENSCA